MPPELPPPSQARSKLEFLYRDLLIEAERLMQRNEETAAKVHETSISLLGLPQSIRQATSTVSDQIGIESARHLQAAAQSLIAAERSLRQANQAVERARSARTWYVMSVAVLSGLFGGLLSALVCAALLT